MRVSNSSIQCFKKCPRMYQLRYVYGFVPQAKFEPLEIGLSYHDAVESAIKGEAQLEPIADPKVSAMVKAFSKHILPTIEHADKFVPEQWFEHKTSRGNIIVGRYDGLGDNMLLEHKTTGQAIDGSYWQGVEDDEQLLTYMLASRKTKAIYTVCKKPTIRKSVRETDEEFAERCEQWYDVDTSSKITCAIVAHTPLEIHQHEQQIDAMCETIKDCKNFYRNRAFCRYFGRVCEYAPICNNCDPDQDYPGFTKMGRDD